RAASGPEDLIRRFGQQVLRHGERLAVVDALAPAEGLTYAALDRRAEALATRLRRRGVGPEVPVGIVARRSAATIVGLLAILKAGGYDVPLEPDDPAPRLAGLVGSLGIATVLTAIDLPPASRDRLPGLMRIDAQDDDDGEAPPAAVAPAP